MLEEPRPVYRIAIVLALIIFISSVTLVSADDNVTSTITETADVTVLNETITESLTEAVPIDTTLQPTEKITPEQITQTPVTKDTDVEPDQITDTVPVANIESGLNDQSLVNHIKIVSGKSDITSFIANNRVLKSTSTKNNNIALKNRLDSYGVQSLDELPISSSIEKFDVVTVDSKNFYEQLKTSQGITFTIDGIDYPAEFSRMNFDTIDDGIDSYQGRLVGSDNSEILFTVSENALLGYITLGNKTYWIEPVTQKNGNNKKANVQLPLYLVYNAKDVVTTGMPFDEIFSLSPDEVQQIEKETDFSYTTNSALSQKYLSTPDARSAALVKTPLSQTVTVNLLVVTDDEFKSFTGIPGDTWLIRAGFIRAYLNQAFGTPDINVAFTSNYVVDDTRSSQLSGNLNIVSRPIKAVLDTYSAQDLNNYPADIILYLGGNDYSAAGIRGESSGFYILKSTDPQNNPPRWARYAWAQMVGEGANSNTMLPLMEQSVLSTHELGHIFGGCHESPRTGSYIEYCPTYAQAYPITTGDYSGKNTVMMSFDNYGIPYFSSDTETPGGSTIGDSSHDNSLAISNVRDMIANCAEVQPAYADFQFSTNPVTGGDQVSFTDLSQGDIVSWDWDFGDGSKSREQNPVHTYITSIPDAQYIVHLIATNCKGAHSRDRTVIINQGSSNSVDASGTPTSGNVPLTIQFTGTATPTPSSWSWNFGDGGASDQPNPSHTYNQAGTYTVSLTVVQDGVQNTRTLDNYINAAPSPVTVVTTTVGTDTVVKFTGSGSTS